LLGPALSLHKVRRGRGCFVCSPLCCFGQADFSLAFIVGYGLRPSRRGPDHDWWGWRWEISRFPGRRLLRIQGLLRRRAAFYFLAINDTDYLAFFWTENISTPNWPYAAQYLAYALPCQRFTCGLAATRASLGAGVACYVFTVMDSHRLPSAGLPASRWRRR